MESKSEKNSLIEILQNFIQLKMDVVMCVPYVTACKLMEETAIKGRLSLYSICPSQLKHKNKKFLAQGKCVV